MGTPDHDAANRWKHAAEETKALAEHDYRVGISSVPFGHENNPATHRYRSWMNGYKELGGEGGRGGVA